MDKVHIEGESKQFIIITFNEVIGFPETTSYAGGYDVEGKIEINSGNYYASGTLWITTGELYKFFEELEIAYNACNGQARLQNSESELDLTIKINRRGRVLISGIFIENPGEENELKFSFESDQSYLVQTLEDLKKIYQKYGGMNGIKDL